MTRNDSFNNIYLGQARVVSRWDKLKTKTSRMVCHGKKWWNMYVIIWKLPCSTYDRARWI